MTHRERILALIRSEPGLTTRQIRERTGIEPHQAVNQACNLLDSQGLIERIRGPDGVFIHLPAGSAPDLPSPKSRAGRSAVVAAGSAELPELSLPETLLVIPCSGSKNKLSGPRSACSSILKSLPPDLAEELKTRRAKNADRAKIEGSGFLPAIERYTGHLYKAAGFGAFEKIAGEGGNLVIMSGGYGLVLPTEPITRYNQKFEPGMWPNRLVGRCLAAYAEAVKARTVVGLLSRSTQYAPAFKATGWPGTTERVFLVSPEPVPGAMVKAPRALGEALKALGEGERIKAAWKSSDGLRMEVTRLK